MTQQVKPAGRNMHATILGAVGLIVLIIGAYIVAVPGAPGRGSGIGTALLVLGVIMLVIALLRFRSKRP